MKGSSPLDEYVSYSGLGDEYVPGGFVLGGGKGWEGERAVICLIGL